MIGMIGFRKALCVGITAAALAVLAVPAGAADEHEQHHPAPGGAAMEQSQAMPGAAGGMGMCSMMQRQGGGVPGMQGMSGMCGRMMGQMGMAGGDMTRHIEGRIAFVRAELEINDAQQPAWNAFADALRNQARAMAQLQASMMAGAMMPPTLLNRLEQQERVLSVRLEGVRNLRATYAQLSQVLNDPQRMMAEELISHHLGMM